jgi:hypothetical protein
VRKAIADKSHALAFAAALTAERELLRSVNRRICGSPIENRRSRRRAPLSNDEAILRRISLIRLSRCTVGVFKRTGDGTLVEFRGVVDALRCATELQNGPMGRNAGLPRKAALIFASAFTSAMLLSDRRFHPLAQTSWIGGWWSGWRRGTHQPAACSRAG